MNKEDKETLIKHLDAMDAENLCDIIRGLNSLGRFSPNISRITVRDKRQVINGKLETRNKKHIKVGNDD